MSAIGFDMLRLLTAVIIGVTAFALICWALDDGMREKKSRR